MGHETVACKGLSIVLLSSCSSCLNTNIFISSYFGKVSLKYTDEAVVTVGIVIVGQTNPGSDSTSLRIVPAMKFDGLVGLADGFATALATIRIRR